MFTTAGAARLITGAKEGSAFCAKTGVETAKAALAARAAREFLMFGNLDGARTLTGRGTDKFRRTRALFLRRADASVNKLCVFCGIFMHTRCCTARKIGPGRPEGAGQPETA